MEHPGFQAYVQQGIVLEVDQSATVNVRLKVGSQSELVTVTREPPLVDTRTETLTTVVTPEMARESPLAETPAAPDIFCLDLYKYFDVDCLEMMASSVHFNQKFIEKIR